MKVTGIIAEYNPFHKGHEYHIKKAKEVTGADYIIVIMSGDFVQRGTPACVEKFVRANMALITGADLVLELPAVYATGTAELFAEGSVTILDKLRVIDSLCFGSECGNTNSLMNIAEILTNETTTYQSELQNHLKSGLSYPAARAAALPEYTDVLNSPNNILGIEYCKALLRLQSKIKPVTITRKGSMYHENELTDLLPSATAIRNKLARNIGYDLSKYIPAHAYELLASEIQKSKVMHEDDFSQMLLYKLLHAKSPEDYLVYENMTNDLAFRIFKSRMQFLSFSQFADSLKTKEITRTRINRALLHILLDIKKNTPKSYYARILGFRKDSAELLTKIKEQSTIPFISKTSTSYRILDKTQKNIFDITTNSSSIYEAVAAQKNNRTLVHEYSKPLIII